MDERLKSYINDQKKKQKSNILKQIGLVEKQYFTSNDNKNDYPLYDYKEKNWYKEDVIDISDEDYAELLKWLPKNIKTEIKKSGWYTYSIILLILNISFVLILMTASTGWPIKESRMISYHKKTGADRKKTGYRPLGPRGENSIRSKRSLVFR